MVLSFSERRLADLAASKDHCALQPELMTSSAPQEIHFATPESFFSTNVWICVFGILSVFRKDWVASVRKSKSAALAFIDEWDINLAVQSICFLSWQTALNDSEEYWQVEPQGP